MENRPARLILSSPEEVALEAADRILKIAREALGTRREFHFVLSGGLTPRRLYEILAGAPFRSQLPWERVHFFWSDERCVGPGHRDSNYRMAREAFLDKLSIPSENLHRIHGETSDPDAAAHDYEDEIKRHFGLGPESPPPCFDLVLLGMGVDGHTASLFPNTQALRETGRWVVANPMPKTKAHRLTLTPVILNRAGWVIFLVTGTDKARAVAEVLEGPFEPERLPSQLIRPICGELLWLLDEAAASSLKTSQKG